MVYLDVPTVPDGGSLTCPVCRHDLGPVEVPLNCQFVHIVCPECKQALHVFDGARRISMEVAR